jgi:hypothetical protein
MATPRQLGYRQPSLLGYRQPQPTWTQDQLDALAIQRAQADRGSNSLVQGWQSTAASMNAGDLSELALEAEQRGDVEAQRGLLRRMAVEQAADRTGAEWALVTAGPTTLTLVRESDFDDAPLQATLDALAQGGNRLADSLASLLDEATRRGYEDAVETELFQIASALDK